MTTEYRLRHPVTGEPAVAVVARYYYQAGRAVGLVVTFADGHRARLTWDEIRELTVVDNNNIMEVEA